MYLYWIRYWHIFFWNIWWWEVNIFKVFRNREVFFFKTVKCLSLTYLTYQTNSYVKKKVWFSCSCFLWLLRHFSSMYPSWLFLLVDKSNGKIGLVGSGLMRITNNCKSKALLNFDFYSLYRAYIASQEWCS